MPSHASDDGLGAAVRSVSEHAVALARLEVRLAKEELRAKASRLGGAAGLAAAAALLALFAVGFVLAAAAAGLDEVLPLWASLLVVGGAIAAVAGVLVALALGLARKARPPVPEQAIDEVKQTTRALRQGQAG